MLASLAPKSRWITMATVKVIPALRASYTLREGKSEAKHDDKARQRPHQLGPCPTVAEVNRASLGMIARLNRSPDHQANLWRWSRPEVKP